MKKAKICFSPYFSPLFLQSPDYQMILRKRESLNFFNNSIQNQPLTLYLFVSMYELGNNFQYLFPQLKS